MKLIRRTAAFTLIELLVVITIIGILLTIAVPQISKGIDSARLLETLSHARSLHAATYAMTLENQQSSEPNTIDWTSTDGGGGTSTATSLTAYFSALTNNSSYLSPSDLVTLLRAPGKKPQIGTVGAKDIAFKIYKLDSNSPGEQIFVSTANWTQGTGMNGTATPFGLKGFVYFTKSGGGGKPTSQTEATSKNAFPTQSGDQTLNYTTTLQ